MKYILMSYILLVAFTAKGQDYAMINDGYISGINDRSVRYLSHRARHSVTWHSVTQECDALKQAILRQVFE